MICTHPNAVQEFRDKTDKIAAMYGHHFPCRKCKKQSAPAGRKKNMIAGKQHGWICADCAGVVRGQDGAQNELASS